MITQANQKNGTVRIIIRAHTAFLPPETLELIAPLLEHTAYRFITGGPLGHRQLIETVRHYVIEDNRLVFSAGLVARVQNHLERQGYVVHIDDRTHWGHLHNADQQVLRDPTLRRPERDFVAALSASPRGQILLDRPSEIGRWIGLTARLFCQHNIFVVARNRTVRDRLVAQISDHTDRPVTSNSREAWSHHPRLLVGTLQLARYAGGEDFEIVVFADVESAQSKATDELAARWPNATWYAFINGQRPLHEGERFHLDEVFGPIIFQPDEGTTDLDVTVVFIKMQRNVRRGYHSGLTRKRYNYWQDTDWNSAVATTAGRLVAGEIPDGVAGNTLNWHEPRVAIIVESTEHGRELRQRLPGWELQTAHDYASCVPAVTHGQIATMTYAVTWGISADVVVRADGGADWPLGEALTVRTIESDHRVLLVDFADHSDERATQDTQSRQAAYQRQGWTIFNTEGVETVAADAT